MYPPWNSSYISVACLSDSLYYRVFLRILWRLEMGIIIIVVAAAVYFDEPHTDLREIEL
jgi:hypothetical protein